MQCKKPIQYRSHCMTYNAGTPRVNTAHLMNYTNRKIAAIAVRTDSLRLNWKPADINTPTSRPVPGTGTASWINVFESEGNPFAPTITTYSPDSQSDWEYTPQTTNTPEYTGEASLISIVAEVVLRLTGDNSTVNTLVLAIFIDGELVGKDTPGYAINESPYMALGVPDYNGTANKATTNLSINLVIPLKRNEKITLQLRQTHSGPLDYDFYSMSLYARPIELTGTELTGKGVAV